MELSDGGSFPNLVRNCHWTIVTDRHSWNISTQNTFSPPFAAILVNCAPSGEMHNYCTLHILKQNWEFLDPSVQIHTAISSVFIILNNSVQSFFNTIHFSHIGTILNTSFVPEKGEMHLKPFTDNHFHFPKIVKLVTSQTSLQRPQLVACWQFRSFSAGSTGSPTQRHVGQNSCCTHFIRNVRSVLSTVWNLRERWFCNYEEA
jgi:hypothetical protein